MLYCPKCHRTYEEGTYRFCVNDETRLLPKPAAENSFSQTSGFFAGAPDRTSAAADEIEAVESSDGFILDLPETDEFSLDEADELFETEFSRDPHVRLGEAEIYQIADADSAQSDADALVGQIIEERYRITETVRQDESNVFYSAEDELDDRTVAIRVFTGDDSKSYLTDRNFAEERTALFLLNHQSVAGILDWGEMPGGEPFVVTEHVEGESVKDVLKRSGKFDAARAAKAIRAASYALGEAHAGGILHRNLTPNNIILSESDGGAETVKLTNFSVSNGKFQKENLAYTAPERVDGQPATAAGDIYSLAVIAFQMLTDRLPSDGASVSDSHVPPLEGLTLLLDNQRLDIELTIDEILEKALSFNPAARYQKAADFGDVFFNAVTKTPPWEADAASAADVEEIKIGEKQPEEIKVSDAEPIRAEPEVVTAPAVIVPPIAEIKPPAEIEPPPQREAEVKPVNAEAAKLAELAVGVAALKQEITKSAEPVKATADLAWEKRSPPPTRAGKNWAVLGLLGAIVLFTVLGLGYYAVNRTNPAETTSTTPSVVERAAAPATNANFQATLPPANQNQALSAAPTETRTTASDAVYFENSKDDLKGEAARNFLGFSLSYPKDWKRNDAKNNFLDISKNAPTGTPVEQLLVSHYDSEGTFEADEKLFTALVKDTSKTLKSLVPNYKTIGRGEVVSNGLRAYEVKFGGSGKTAKGENIKLWGRRLFIPAAREGVKNGYVLTMLATSLSPDVKSIEDVGVRGDLQTILDKFEPKF